MDGKANGGTGLRDGDDSVPPQEQALWPTEDNGHAGELIKRKARRLRATGNLEFLDTQETEQRLTIRLWKSRRNFDPRKGRWQSYSQRVVNHAAKQIFRDSRVKKRTAALISLDSPLGSAERASLRDQISETDTLRRLGVHKPNPFECVDHQLDVHELTSCLSQVERGLLTAHVELGTSRLAKLLGVPRTSIDCRLRRLYKRCRAESKKI